MITSNTISEHGFMYIAMFIEDLVKYQGMSEGRGEGMRFHNVWASPETCYWLYCFLKENSFDLANPQVLEALKSGTNHPEILR